MAAASHPYAVRREQLAVELVLELEEAEWNYTVRCREISPFSEQVLPQDRHDGIGANNPEEMARSPSLCRLGAELNKKNKQRTATRTLNTARCGALRHCRLAFTEAEDTVLLQRCAADGDTVRSGADLCGAARGDPYTGPAPEPKRADTVTTSHRD